MPVDRWGSVASGIQQQLKEPSHDNPKSPQDIYTACLAKVDYDAVTSVWYLMFDMVPVEAAVLGLKADAVNWPTMPTILFHATDVPTDVVLRVLNVDADGPMEGAWYSLFLVKDGDPKHDLVGELYPPDDEFTSSDPWTPRYGKWHIADAQLAFFPTLDGPNVILAPAKPQSRPEAFMDNNGNGNGGGQGGMKRAFSQISGLKLDGGKSAPRVKKVALSPANMPPQQQPPPPAAFGALGVMDIGQGGCNVLFDRGLEPVGYYDAGYPLGFFRRTLPATMRADLLTFTGPIFQNAANNLQVILSHWDWDHWRLGRLNHNGNSLGALPWIVPAQPMSPTAQNFVNNQLLGHVTVIAGGAGPQVYPNGAAGTNIMLTLYKMVPPVGAFGGVLINNSGLAIRFSLDLAAGPASQVLLTGDGNFNLLPLPVNGGLTGIGAVHHGSAHHNAANNLPAAPGIGTGYVVYSYGVNRNTGGHAYNFPAAAAVANYQAANWAAPTEMGTAEGAQINAGGAPPPGAQGNVRMGSQNPLPGAYAGTAFAAIGHALA